MQPSFVVGSEFAYDRFREAEGPQRVDSSHSLGDGVRLLVVRSGRPARSGTTILFCGRHIYGSRRSRRRAESEVPGPKYLVPGTRYVEASATFVSNGATTARFDINARPSCPQCRASSQPAALASFVIRIVPTRVSLRPVRSPCSRQDKIEQESALHAPVCPVS